MADVTAVLLATQNPGLPCSHVPPHAHAASCHPALTHVGVQIMRHGPPPSSSSSRWRSRTRCALALYSLGRRGGQEDEESGGGGGGEAGGTGAYAEGERGAQSLNFSRRPGTRLPPPSSPLSPGRYAKATQDPHPTGYRALTRCSLLPRTRLCSSSRSPKCSQTTARMPPLVSQLVSS
jgi:hypothetical protein